VPFLLFETVIGPTGLAWNEVGITALQLPEATIAETRARLVARARQEGTEGTVRTAPPWVNDTIDRVRTHLEGRPQDLSGVRLDFGHLTPFSARVYRALRLVPAGRTVSYADLAHTVGSPGAARAVGRAMATNPFPIVVPCHRVLASGGKFGGFSAFGGLTTKDRLLAIEKAPVRLHTSVKARRQHTNLPYDAEAAIRHLVAADPVLGRHIARVGPFALRLRQTKDVFVALAEAVVYQQLSGKAAATIFARVSALYPSDRLEPKRVLATKDSVLRGAGLSRAKLASLRDLAQRSEAGDVPTLKALAKMDDQAIVDTLTAVRGIGRWTVEMLLMFRLGRPDVLPVADYGIRKGFARVFRSRRSRGNDDVLPSPVDIARRGQRWRPYRSVASWYLWRALDS
jgi:methylated-DNA-[protein]-cysteine S-methyltransferase